MRRVLKPSGQFRFNVRAFDPRAAFANRPGGWLARFLYWIDWYSPLKTRWQSGGGAEFNGLQFRARDVRKLLRTADLSIVTLERRMVDADGWWVTVSRNEV